MFDKWAFGGIAIVSTRMICVILYGPCDSFLVLDQEQHGSIQCILSIRDHIHTSSQRKTKRNEVTTTKKRIKWRLKSWTFKIIISFSSSLWFLHFMNDESLDGFVPFDWHDAFLMLECVYFHLLLMNNWRSAFVAYFSTQSNEIGLI